MRAKHFIMTLCLLLVALTTAMAQAVTPAQGQQKNVLTVPDVTMGQGTSILLPVQVTNTTDIVAAQFTITVPDELTLSPGTAKLTDRADGHAVTMRAIGSHKYMAMVHSAQNKPVKLRTGTLLTVELHASSSAEEGKEYTLSLSDVVLANAKGDNMLTSYQNGKVTIAKSPDLEVSAVTTSAASVVPKGNLTVNWQVKNTGGLATNGGWKENVYLTSADGLYDKLIASQEYDNTLDAGAAVSRSLELTLPSELGISDNAKVKVVVKPRSDTGEPSWLQENNIGVTDRALSVAKLLYLTPDSANIDEATAKTVRFYLSRSGSTSAEESFSLTATADPRLTWPSVVTVPRGQAGIYFYAQVTANGKLDDNDSLTMSVEGNGYAAVQGSVIVEDDTYPSLSISSSQIDVTEGGKITFTVKTERISNQDIQVSLACDLPTRFRIPTDIVIPAGRESIDVEVEAIDDDTPDIEKVVTMTASALGYNAGTMLTTLVDNDIPSLQLTLTPAAVSEGAGPLAVTAKLKRTDNIDKTVTIKFSDDSNGGVHYARQTIEMASGVEEMDINLGPVDNALVDGERTYNITAAVFIASCSCNATVGTSGGSVTVPLTVYDNDGPTLTLTAPAATLKEGEEATLTITRNTDTKNALAVSLSSDHDDALEYPSVVTIPAGKTSVEVTVKSKKNKTSGDDFIATITAQADGYSKGSFWLSVSDQNLPDAQIASLALVTTKVEAGGDAMVKMMLANTGYAALPEQTPVYFYLSNSNKSVATAYLQEALAAGDSTEIVRTLTIPKAVGNYRLYAVVNEEKTVKELLYTNNTSASIDIATVSPFGYTIAVDKTQYKQGETVSVTGAVSGRDIANKTVEIYVVNEGYRHTIEVTTDANGGFKADYTPYAGQAGHFAVGVCYPGENATAEMTSFDVYGLRRATNTAITCEANLGEKYNGTISIVNPTSLSLSGMKVSVVSSPADCNVTASVPASLAGKATSDISFEITPNAVSQGSDWEKIELNVETQEGATLSVTLYYYCRTTKGKLQASVASINTTMVKGTTRDYPITLMNVGKGATGKITLSLPSWMTTATPQEMPSLDKDATTDVILRLTPTADMQLNVPVSGTIGINCANGEGLSLPFYIEPVSETTGTLTIDVCDENTYYTKEAPHLAGATVTVKHPTTGAVVSTGTTGQDGLCSFTLLEGYYAVTVTAEKHNTYSNNLLVDPGKEKKVTVNLSISAIKISYDVVETEVEDQYEIVTTTTFETNVPRPVVVAAAPKSIQGDNMKDGDAVIINFILTNKGLINAENVKVSLPTDLKGWEIRALEGLEASVLAPQSSISFPILITKVPTTVNSKSLRVNSNSPISACMAGMEYEYAWRCGRELKTDEALYRMALKTCANSAILGVISGQMGNIGGGNSGGDGGDIKAPISNPSDDGHLYIPGEDEQVISTYDPLCDPNRTKCGEELLNKLRDKIPGIGPILGKIDEAANKAISAAENGGKLPPDELMELAQDLAKEASDALEGGADELDGLADDLEEVLDACGEFVKDQAARDAKMQSARQGVRYSVIMAINLIIDELRKLDKILLNYYGSRVWYTHLDSEKSKFFNYLGTLNSLENLDEQEMSAYKPSSVSLKDCRILIDHLKRYWGDVSTWKQTKDEISPCLEHEANAIELGYDSFNDLYIKKIEEAYKEVTESSSGSVCSSITLQFTQQMTMTRQAFRGTLSIFNGSEDTSMDDIKLSLTVKDENGNIAGSNKFQINPEKLDGFGGSLDFNSGWTLEAQKTGTATILFIPTKNAAPTTPQRYSFGGTVSYIDPFTGLEMTRELSPITLTVKPSPNLNLTYFMQRDIKGDNPLTADVVEPSEEAEFSVLINNVGYGDATDIRMVTNQPEIVANEKGLAVKFNLVSSQLNGEEKSLALGGSVATEFGTIPAKKTAYAQWWITSSLLGHFTSYDVEANHLSSYGNPDLSLLNEVTIHELIRSIDIKKGNEKMVGFLTNDIVDAEDTPDMLYLSNGEVEEVSKVEDAQLVKVSATEYQLTVTPSKKGWNYGSVSDPTYGISVLKEIACRNSSEEIGERRIWQTDCTLRDGKDPLYENLLHFVDDFEDGMPKTYTLTFEPTPELVLEVAAIEGAPAGEGEIAEQPVGQLKVVFNKPVDAQTFTADDLTFVIQGKQQEADRIGISTDDNKTFVLDLSKWTENAENGFYSITVQTAGITDWEGYHGKGGKNASWTMFKDGLVRLLTSANPAKGGDITRVADPSAQAKDNTSLMAAEAAPDDMLEYGTTFKLQATPREGYEFVSWSLDGEVISTEPVLEQVSLRDYEFVANFKKAPCTVTIDAGCEGGHIEGCHTGIYDQGSEMVLTAVADEDYVFDSWIVNGMTVEATEQMTFVVDGEAAVTAKFTREIFHQKMTLYKGWNWVSSYLKENVATDNFLLNSAVIVGCGEETDVLLPVTTYKVKALSSFVDYSKGHLYDAKTDAPSLAAGWNWLGYPYSYSSLLTEAIANAEEGDAVVGQSGFAEYSGNRWEGTLTTLTPNQGYLYKSANGKTLTFRLDKVPATQGEAVVENYGSAEPNPRQYQEVMSIIALVKEKGEPVAKGNLLVTARVDDELRGVGKIVNGKYYLAVYGTTGEDVEFFIENEETGDKTEIAETMSFREDLIGNRKSPYILDLDFATGIDAIFAHGKIVKVYNLQGILMDGFATRKSMEKLPAGVYIVNGKKLVRK
jgi:hypothetical protein